MTHSDPRRTDEERRAEAERVLRRAEQDSTPILGSAFARTADFLSARDAGDDPAEIWGKRIGRGLAILGGIACVIYLVVTYAPS